MMDKLLAHITNPYHYALVRLYLLSRTGAFPFEVDISKVLPDA